MLFVSHILAAGLASTCPAYVDLQQPQPGTVYTYAGERNAMPLSLRETIRSVSDRGIVIQREMAIGGAPLSPLGEEISAVGGLIAVSRQQAASQSVFFSASEVESIARMTEGETLEFTVSSPEGNRDLLIRFDGCRDGIAGRESLYSRWYAEAPGAVSTVIISHNDGWWVSREGGEISFNRD